MVECADRQAFENRIAQPQARVALAGRNPKQGLDRHGLARHLLLLSHLMQIYLQHEPSPSNRDISPVRPCLLPAGSFTPALCGAILRLAGGLIRSTHQGPDSFPPAFGLRQKVIVATPQTTIEKKT